MSELDISKLLGDGNPPPRRHFQPQLHARLTAEGYSYELLSSSSPHLPQLEIYKSPNGDVEYECTQTGYVYVTNTNTKEGWKRTMVGRGRRKISLTTTTARPVQEPGALFFQ
jgi:hypothetical protein